MSQPAALASASFSQPRSAARSASTTIRPFCGLIDPVLVEEPVPFPFSGSVSRDAARAAWTWIARDVCPDLVSLAGIEQGTLQPGDIEPLMAEILTRSKAALDKAEADGEAM
ncbi:MAG TPA: hypothetical protein VGE47_05420, partial [Burkholderiaceae bacterium]